MFLSPPQVSRLSSLLCRHIVSTICGKFEKYHRTHRTGSHFLLQRSKLGPFQGKSPFFSVLSWSIWLTRIANDTWGRNSTVGVHKGKGGVKNPSRKHQKVHFTPVSLPKTLCKKSFLHLKTEEGPSAFYT